MLNTELLTPQNVAVIAAFTIVAFMIFSHFKKESQ